MTDDQAIAELMAELREEMGVDGPGAEIMVKIAMKVFRRLSRDPEDDHR